MVLYIGKPSALFDTENPDWVPTLNLGHLDKKTSASNVGRFERAKRRSSTNWSMNAAFQGSPDQSKTCMR